MTDTNQPPQALALSDVEDRAAAVARTAARLLYHRLAAFPNQPKPNAKIPDYALPQVQLMADAMMAVYQQGFRDGGDWIVKAQDAINTLEEPK